MPGLLIPDVGPLATRTALLPVGAFWKFHEEVAWGQWLLPFQTCPHCCEVVEGCREKAVLGRPRFTSPQRGLRVPLCLSATCFCPFVSQQNVLRIYYGPSIVLESEDTAVNKTDRVLHP